MDEIYNQFGKKVSFGEYVIIKDRKVQHDVTQQVIKYLKTLEMIYTISRNIVLGEQERKRNCGKVIKDGVMLYLSANFCFYKVKPFFT